MQNSRQPRNFLKSHKESFYLVHLWSRNAEPFPTALLQVGAHPGGLNWVLWMCCLLGERRLGIADPSRVYDKATKKCVHCMGRRFDVSLKSRVLQFGVLTVM